MHIHLKPRWQLPDSLVIPETHYLHRREFLRTIGLGLAASAFLPPTLEASTTGLPDSPNPAFKLAGVKLTPYNLITTYNNFFEWAKEKKAPRKLANQG